MIKKNIKTLTSVLFIIGLFFIFIGGFGIIKPLKLSVNLVTILAILFSINGIKNLYKGIQLRHIQNSNWELVIITSILEMMIALSIIFTPLISQITLIIYIGIFMIFKGVFILFHIIFSKKTPGSITSLNIGNSILDILFGIIFLIFPFIAQQFMFLCIAWYILFSGLELIKTSYSLEKINNI